MGKKNDLPTNEHSQNILWFRWKLHPWFRVYLKKVFAYFFSSAWSPRYKCLVFLIFLRCELIFLKSFCENFWAVDPLCMDLETV